MILCLNVGGKKVGSHLKNWPMPPRINHSQTAGDLNLFIYPSSWLNFTPLHSSPSHLYPLSHGQSRGRFHREDEKNRKMFLMIFYHEVMHPLILEGHSLYEDRLYFPAPTPDLSKALNVNYNDHLSQWFHKHCHEIVWDYCDLKPFPTVGNHTVSFKLMRRNCSLSLSYFISNAMRAQTLIFHCNLNFQREIVNLVNIK